LGSVNVGLGSIHTSNIWNSWVIFIYHFCSESEWGISLLVSEALALIKSKKIEKPGECCIFQQLNLINMKHLKIFTAAVLTISTLTVPLSGLAADQNSEKKPKPYVLKTCSVSDEKLDSMGKPVSYVHEGREIQFCCKDCIKTFKKNPAKYVKKIEAAEAKVKKNG